MKPQNSSSTYIILIYHKVGKGYSDFIPALDIKIFTKQIKLLRKFYEIISFQDLINGNFKKNKRTKIIITFDDGYRCIYQYAYPVLKQYTVPATIFLTTEAVENKVPIWPDLLSYYMSATKISKLDLVIKNRPLIFEFSDIKSKLFTSKRLKELLKRISNNERLLLIREIEKNLKVDKPVDGILDMLTWDEIREMSKNNITFGNHTMTHPILTQLSLDEVKLEIEGAQKTIKNKIGTSAPIFAYPNGENIDFNENIKKILADYGYKMSCATIFGSNDQYADPYALKRVYTSGNNILKFILRLQKARRVKNI